ncbi:MAG: Glu/Leu/Phe/Val dehydrogenase [Acholeplasmatales bacterium]|nr:MAG: Glu/Leu/Phe/Val dehydrogenase [Acholeplasmatales bacterium]
MKKFEYMEKHGYEQLVYFHDKATGLKGITCIHNTTLGPALGGTRLWNYDNEDDATLDVLRLARGMTYKAAAAGLNLGGGKTVLIGDAEKVKNEGYFRGLGRYVQTLNGRYITAEDVNVHAKDLDFVNMETDFVVGLKHKSGNPSPMTSLGCFHGIRASLKVIFGSDSIVGRTFAVQGAGETGDYLIEYLRDAGAGQIYFTEINEKHIKKIGEKYPEVTFVEPDKIYELDVDVFAPCALGAVMNDKTIPRLKCKIVAGTANNVLDDEQKHGLMLKEAGILYAPDFVINAGGLINVYHELQGYKRENAVNDIEKIYDRLELIYKLAEEKDTDTQEAAKIFAKDRIATISTVRSNFVKR